MDRRPQPIPANARPRLGHRQPGSIIAAVALSMSMSLGLLGATVGLFQQDGAPLGHVVVAERACSAYRWFVSEREACIAMYLAASRQTIASR